MTRITKSTVGAALLLAGMTAPALADVGDVRVTNFSPKPLVVSSNGQSYTKLKNLGNTNVQIRFEYDVGSVGRVKSWKVWPHITNGYGIAANLGNLEGYAYSKSYSVGNRPKVVDRTVAVAIPAALYKDHAVNMCNWLASNLRNQGLSNNQIFSQDREVHFDARADFKVSATGAGSNNALYQYNPAYKIKVRCAKWQGTKVPLGGNASLKNPLHVKKATMQLKEIATMAGACAVKLTTAISTNTAGATIKYRYVHSSGKKSKVFTTKTAANKIAVVTHQWDIPNKSGPENGAMQLVGVNHNFKSNVRHYSMKCTDGPGGFKPNPKKPKVRIPLGSTSLSN